MANCQLFQDKELVSLKYLVNPSSSSPKLKEESQVKRGPLTLVVVQRSMTRLVSIASIHAVNYDAKTSTFDLHVINLGHIDGKREYY